MVKRVKPSIIYCDLDGVLADFDLMYEQKFGLSRKVSDHKSDQEFWERITLYRAHGYMTGTYKGWFDELPLKPDALELWNYLKSTKIPLVILTATGMDRDRAVMEKKYWIFNNLGPNHLPLFVTSGKEKHRYATKTAILIDDTPKCINPWNQAGGTGILHTDSKTTIQQLKAILEKE
jgi:hypothetical protein